MTAIASKWPMVVDPCVAFCNRGGEVLILLCRWIGGRVRAAWAWWTGDEGARFRDGVWKVVVTIAEVVGAIILLLGAFLIISQMLSGGKKCEHEEKKFRF